jgi:tetratricopeptide (TPR) repeat protein
MRVVGTLAILAAMAGLGAAAPAPSTTVMFSGTNSDAVFCSKHAKQASTIRMSMVEQLAPCTAAIETEPLTNRELAATYVNRGVIFLHSMMMGDAKQDFDRAASLDAQMGEAYVNRGATLVAMHQDAAALADIEKGLALGVEEPSHAYFNKGLALENLGDVKGAYESYMKAAELAPEWQDPKNELSRFTVSGR